MKFYMYRGMEVSVSQEMQRSDDADRFWDRMNQPDVRTSADSYQEIARKMEEEWSRLVSHASGTTRPRFIFTSHSFRKAVREYREVRHWRGRKYVLHPLALIC